MKIRVSVGDTVAVGNFESTRLDISIETPPDIKINNEGIERVKVTNEEDLQKAITRLYNQVYIAKERLLQEQINDIENKRKSAGNQFTYFQTRKK
ncbi:MAG: hypothetical protein GF317_09850 [Candidatus Lokiarchaeota archaeon]|nr:hypothetical protein [Candidatus Lokiarchaeota archaeon]